MLSVPLKQDKQVGESLHLAIVEEVVLATDAHSDVVVNLEQLVLVADTQHLLIFGLLMRVVSLELLEFLGVLRRLQHLLVDLGGLLHELAGAVD